LPPKGNFATEPEELGKLQSQIANYKYQENQVIEAVKRRQKEELEKVLEQHKKIDEDTEKKIKATYERAQAPEESRENKITRERGGPTQGYYMRFEPPW
jgi:hypothetical protein